MLLDFQNALNTFSILTVQKIWLVNTNMIMYNVRCVCIYMELKKVRSLMGT